MWTLWYVVLSVRVLIIVLHFSPQQEKYLLIKAPLIVFVPMAHVFLQHLSKYIGVVCFQIVYYKLLLLQ